MLFFIVHLICRNLSLGLATKARVDKVAGQKGSPGMKESVREWTFTLPRQFTLGDRVPVDSRIFTGGFQWSKLHGSKSSLYQWKDIGTYMSKMDSHHPFGHLKHKFWPKERSGVKLAVWLSTTKSRESTWFTCVQVAYNILLKSSQRGLQLCFRPHLHRRSTRKVMGFQSRRNPNFGNFETPTWESWDKKSFGCRPHG